MPKRRPRVFSREFKLAAVERLEAGESASALARELGVFRQAVERWRERVRQGGPAALGGTGRPRKADLAAMAAWPTRPPEELELRAARARIAELERKFGRQQLELDFFKRALREVEVSRRPSEGPGATASTPSSKR